MQLVIDIGNSCTKLGFFENKRLKEHFSAVGLITRTEIQEIVFNKKLDAVIVSTVRADSNKLVSFLQKKYNALLLSRQLKFPFKSLYKTPATLGHDRIANAAAAVKSFPRQDILVVDAGTCLKIDFTDKRGFYHGGSIAPGLMMRFEALHHYTGNLPLIKPGRFRKLTGQTTEESIVAGVQLGMIHEVTETILQYKKKVPGLNIILTGGDWRLFAKPLKKTIFADPFFTLKGLYFILEHNTTDE